MSETATPKLTRKAMQVRLENLICKISRTDIRINSIEDGFDILQLYITDTMHNLESTMRERNFLVSKLGKQ